MINMLAFPVTPDCLLDCRGMTLRDYFAIHVCTPSQGELDTEMAFRGWQEWNKKDSAKEVWRRTLEVEVYLRYKFADAMLAERNKNDTNAIND